jgi:hypothetical protein
MVYDVPAIDRRRRSNVPALNLQAKCCCFRNAFNAQVAEISIRFKDAGVPVSARRPTHQKP